MDLEHIRDRSVRAAKDIGVDVLPTLPLLHPECVMRAADEVAARLLAMHPAAAVAYGLDRARAISWLHRETLLGALSDQERRFLFEEDGDPDRFEAQIEGMWALAWALGVVGELDPTKHCDDRFVELLPDLRQEQPSDRFRERIRPRSLGQVVAACDLAYCLHWAIRQCELDGKGPPRGLKPSIVVERRRALEWLLYDEAWDDVSLDT